METQNHSKYDEFFKNRKFKNKDNMILFVEKTRKEFGPQTISIALDSFVTDRKEDEDVKSELVLLADFWGKVYDAESIYNSAWNSDWVIKQMRLQNPASYLAVHLPFRSCGVEEQCWEFFNCMCLLAGRENPCLLDAVSDSDSSSSSSSDEEY